MGRELPEVLRACTYGWKDSANLQHTDACRQGTEGELATTETGKARIALSKTRMERRQGAAVAVDGKEEETGAVAVSRQFL